MVSTLKPIVFQLKLLGVSILSKDALPCEEFRSFLREVRILTQNRLVAILLTSVIVNDFEYVFHTEGDRATLVWRHVEQNFIWQEGVPRVPIVSNSLLVAHSLHVEHALNVLLYLIRVPHDDLHRQAKCRA